MEMTYCVSIKYLWVNDYLQGESTPRVHQEYTKSTPRVHQEYTKSTPRVHQEYTKSTPRVHQEYTNQREALS